MNHSQLIDELLQELSYRVGIVDIYNKEQQSIMSEILTEWGEFEAKETIFNFLNEADEKRFKNPILNRKITYVGKDGKEREGLVGNLITAPKDSPGRIEAEKILPPEGSDERNAINQEIGSQGGGGPQDDQTSGTQQSDNTSKTQTGSAVSATTKSGQSYQKNRVNKEKETLEKLQDEESDNTSKIEEKKQELRTKDEQLVKTQLFLYEGDDQDAGGLGTPESRTGETVTVYAGSKIKKLISGGMSYEDAREQVRQELLKHASSKKNGKKALLTKEWVEAGLRCLDWINENIGLDNIEDFAWDTPEGNELVGSTGHGTSADMFVKTTDGQTIGISLKKDFKVFVFNGGYDKTIGNFAESLGLSVDELPDELQYKGNPKSYEAKRDKIYEERVELFNNDDVKKKVCENIEKAKSSDDGYVEVFGSRTVSNKKRLGIIAKNAEKDISDVTCDDLYNFVINKPNPTKDDKAVVYAFAQYDSEIEKGTNGLYSTTRQLDNQQRDAFYSFVTTQPYEDKFKEVVAEHTHIDDVLFGTKGDQLDKLEVVYGEPPAGESMKKQALISMFDLGDLYDKYENEKDPQKKEELKKEIQRQYKEKMVIDKESNPPRVGVRVANPVPPPDTSIQPLFTLGVRAKGITAAPALEMGQTVFGGLCFKNGTVDINKWPDGDRKKFVNSEVKRIQEDFNDDSIDYSNETEVNELISYLERLNNLQSVPKIKKLIDLIKSKQN